MTWRLPGTYHLTGGGQGTATFKFYEGRDILDFRISPRLQNHPRTRRRTRSHTHPAAVRPAGLRFSDKGKGSGDTYYGASLALTTA